MHRTILSAALFAAFAGIASSVQAQNVTPQQQVTTSAVRADSLVQGAGPAEAAFGDDERELELDAVAVTAQRRLIKLEPDKMTYAVSQDEEAKSATILDMLRKVPMVTVDGQDNITVNGSSAFKVYLDGKPNPMFSANPSQIFKSMPASIVKKIEVITNPGAKYDAEGVGGILNIVLDRDVMTGGGPASAGINGVNGNVRLEGGNRGFGGSVFLSAQHDKLTFTANYTTNQMLLRGTEVDMTQEQLAPVSMTTVMHQENGRTHHPFNMANLGLGYAIDERQTVNVNVDYSGFKMHNRGPLTTTMTGALMPPEGLAYSMDNDLLTRRDGINASADYQCFFNDEHTSSLSLTYLFSRNPSTTENRSEYDTAALLPGQYADYLQDRYSDNNERSTEHTAQLDYTAALADEAFKFNAGAKFTSHNSLSEADYYYGRGTDLILQDGANGTLPLSSTYDNTKSILAGYGEFEGKFDDFGLRAGARYEHTWQSVDFRRGPGGDYRNNYGNLVPSLSITYSPMAIANVGLSYNLRISRPGISFLNPYVDRSVNTALTYGNPDLDVETSHNIGLVANLFTPAFMFSFNARYAYTPNAIEKYSFYREGILHNTYGNIVERQLTTLSLFASWLVHPKTRLFTNCAVTYNDMKSSHLDVAHHGWQYNLMGGVQQTLPKHFNAGLFVMYNSPTLTLQGRNAGFNMITANVSRSFLHDKFDLSLRGMTTLRADGKVHFEMTATGHDFASSTIITSPLWGVTLSLTYKFGNSKVSVRQHTTKVKSDIRENTNQMEQLGNGAGQSLEGLMK